MVKEFQNKKVFVGLSGGVDSSVSAALLKEQGFDVTGVFIKVWNPDWLLCTWKEERRDAMRVAASLGIPFMTFDLSEEYKKSVVDYMIEEYKAGRTPNPDVMCNKEIKFGAFMKKALEMGADYVATGHYACITPWPPLKLRGGSTERSEMQGVILQESADKSKDQSYFLWTLTQDQLKKIIFPVGAMQKEEVRKLAKKFKLPTAEKKDSQGICILGKIDLKEFLSHYIPNKIGDVLDESGKIIGKHNGAVFYTIGERHGFEINKKSEKDEPYYVISKDISKNTITVSQKRKYLEDLDEKAGKKIKLVNINWTIKPIQDKKYSARIRYRQAKQECIVKDNEVSFAKLVPDISVGQSLVLYDNELCIGGGIIAEVV